MKSPRSDRGEGFFVTALLNRQSGPWALADIDRHAADLSELHVPVADDVVVRRITHRRRAIAAPGLMEENFGMVGLYLTDEGKRRRRGGDARFRGWIGHRVFLGESACSATSTDRLPPPCGEGWVRTHDNFRTHGS